MCLSLLCCCLGPGTCGLCCGPSKVKSSITTRLLYTLFIVFAVVVSAIMLSPHVQQELAKAPILCEPLNFKPPSEIPVSQSININSLLNCSSLVGYFAVYRINMAIASFFFILTIIMLCVFSSKDPRSYVQNGFWLIKWLVVLALIVGFFFIPEGQNFVFARVSLGFGLTGAIIFIVVQVLLLVDFAHTTAEKLLTRAEDNKWWYIALAIPTVTCYLVSVIGIILLYVFFTNLSGCALNKFFISSTLLISVIISVIAILPWVQRVQPRSGLLQASVVTLYGTYLTWSAVATEPYGESCTVMNNTVAVFGHSNSSALAASIVGIVVLLVTVAYTCVHLSSSSQMKKFRGGKKDDEYSPLGEGMENVYIKHDEKEEEEDSEEDKSRWQMNVVDDEKNEVTYSYSFFHFLMLLATLYLMMQLTNWADPGVADFERFQNTWASTWVKMATVWFSFALYIWTLVAPLVLVCRDFGYTDE